MKKEMLKYDVYALGNALVDIVLEVDEDFLLAHDIQKGVMTLVDEAKQMRMMQAFDMKSSKTSAGGSAANTAIVINQLGGKSACSFLIARDELGKIFIEDMQRNGVDIHLEYEKCPSAGHSGRCLVMVTPDADRTMNTFLGISSSFSASDVDTEFVKLSTYVYLEGYLVAMEKSMDAMIRAKEVATRNGTLTALSLSDPNIVKFFGSRLERVIGDGIDLLFCNEQEALLYMGAVSLEDACQKLKQVAKCFVVTRGPRGARVYDGNRFFDVEPYMQGTRVLDTNGAGDTFAGGFLYGLTQGFSYEKAGEIASVAASKVISQLGPRLEPDRAKGILLDVGL